MAKRFTDTEKYKDPWFRRLPPKLKTLFYFMCDDCNHAGVWKENFDMFEMFFKIKVTHDDMKEFGEKIVRLDNDTYFLTSFIKFQYGTLNKANNAHQGVIKSLNYNNIEISPYLAPAKPLPSPCLGAQDKEQDKDMDMDKEQEQDNKRGIQGGNKKSTKLNPDEVEVLNYLNTVSGKSYKPIEKNFKFIRSVLKNFTVDEAKAVVDLKQSQWAHSEEMAKYIRPETIFGSKFESYLQETNSNTPKTIGELFRSMGFKGQEL